MGSLVYAKMALNPADAALHKGANNRGENSPCDGLTACPGIKQGWKMHGELSALDSIGV